MSRRLTRRLTVNPILQTEALPGMLRRLPGRFGRPATMVGVAQLAERQVVVLDVVGSNPIAHPTCFAWSETCLTIMQR